MTELPSFGDLVTYRGRSFTFHSMYEGDSWPHDRCVVESVDPGWHKFNEPDNEQYLWSHMHDDLYILYLDECKVTKASDPETFTGMGI